MNHPIGIRASRLKRTGERQIEGLQTNVQRLKEYKSKLILIKRVDFPTESNSQETPCQDTCRQRVILAIDGSDKSLPRLLICASNRERSLASNVMP